MDLMTSVMVIGLFVVAILVLVLIIHFFNAKEMKEFEKDFE